MPSYNAESYVRLEAMKVFLATVNAIAVARAQVQPHTQVFQREHFWVPRQFLDHELNQLNDLHDVGDLIIPRWIADKNDVTNWEYVT